MATTGSGHMPHSFALRSGLPTFGTFGNTLLERSNPGLRKSTPDSEALASSDEEVEQSRLRSAAQRKAQNRRSSLFAEQSQDSKRLSFVGNNTYSPATGSQPNTPGGMNENWSTISPSLGTWNTGTAYPFGANIWGSKETNASRLSEAQRQDNSERHSFSNSSHPNPSVHRSLSFSVGQSEHDAHPVLNSSTTDNSGRPNQYLTRRSSRQSNLAAEASTLGRVDEVEHNPISTSFTQPRMQSRTMSNMSTGFRTIGLRNSVHERSEIAIDDIDEPVVHARVPIRNAPSRRLSDIQAITSSRGSIGQPFSTSAFVRSSRDNLHWSSGADLGQGHLETIPASRRHSFADVPTRRGSLGSTEDNVPGPTYDRTSSVLLEDQDASYFDKDFPTKEVARMITQKVEEQLRQDHQQAIFGGPTPYNVVPSSSSIGSFHGPNPAPLLIVNFKCCRSEIFFVAEGAGLVLQEGDLVIVEADRGTDLGSVQHINVSWEAARKYKTLYAEQHFQWLMMFSNQSRIGAPNLFNPNAVVPGNGGVNLPGHGSRDGDIKPKLIKRLAQAHEIQALQDKEGNEAKAKRVCQQKVQDHGLNMEILDAEFQMDGKKLTFYFFSTEYINFNSLVTDLFKLYKTRIWMSAINPASFQSPVSQLGLTPIYPNTGPGAASVPTTTNIYNESRDDSRYFAQAPQHQAQQRAMPQLYYPGYGQAGQVAHVGAIGSGPLTGQVGPANGYGGGLPPTYQQPLLRTDPFSAHGAPSYSARASRPQNMGTSRFGNQAQPVQRADGTFTNQFNSLSLAR